jgi:hypothetical protein
VKTLGLPNNVWLGQDVFIIGGGPSLKGFDWSLLRGANTIGCNDAYTLGADVCKICVFADLKFFTHHKEALAMYKGAIYAFPPTFDSPPEWITVLKQYAAGLETDGIAMNSNTGFGALNLALIMGAARVYLLGFDMKRLPLSAADLEELGCLAEGTACNWHPNGLDKNPDGVYEKFLGYSSRLKQAWQEKFSHVEIFNVTDDSALEIFPKIPTAQFWKRRQVG